MRAGLVLAICACNSTDPPPNTTEIPGRPSPSDKLAGMLMVGADKATLTACLPGHAQRVFVEVTTSLGKLRFEDMKLFWNPTTDSPDRGAELDCKRLDRSWGGGTRTNGTSYWRGTLAFTCLHGDKAVAGNLELDCGMISVEERGQLDRNRTEMLDEQRANKQ